MQVITGAAGFIGSCWASCLNRQGEQDLLLVDAFDRPDKHKNWIDKQYQEQIERSDFLEWFLEYAKEVDIVYHLGARTDTTEKDQAIFDRLNLNYSKAIFDICAKHQIPLIYASSAATYGLGERGYDDRIAPEKLAPLNPYGKSKNDFDAWALAQAQQPLFWAGLKFFNVYGPNEYHKGRMASVVFHTFRQIGETGKMRLFRSHRPDVKDGQQSRDFIYVQDLLNILDFMRTERPENGLYNVGTGQARSFWDLATATFAAMSKTPKIEFIDTPEDIRDTYQYFTKADMSKLRQAGYSKDFCSLEAGIEDYVQEYLMKDETY